MTNGKGERELSGSAWNLLRSAKEKGSTRKGWTFVRFIDAPKKKSAKASATAAPGALGTSTYIPPEVAAAATQAAVEATMLAGEMVTPEEVLAANSKDEAPAPIKEVVEPESQAQAAAAAKAEAPQASVHQDVLKDDLKKVKNVGPKTEQVINSIGVYTYAQLRDVDSKALEEALEANGLGVKKALVPHWKKDAGNILNPQAAE